MTLPIVIVYAVRDEPQWLVDDLRRNVAWADGFVELDNRADRTSGWQHEGAMRRAQRAMVAGAYPDGAWVLQLDPDERLEDRAGAVVPALAAAAEAEHGRRVCRVSMSFPLREMWTPTEFRADGGWACKKPRARMFAYLPGREGTYSFPDKPIHVGVLPRRRTDDVRIPTDIWLMHLKCIEPMNRVRRAQAYLAADPDFQHQRREGRDWTWLFDETGLELQPVPAERTFTPPYTRPYQFVAPGDRIPERTH